MTIHLTESDLHSVIKDTATRILEQYINFQDEYLTRIPYPIELVFTDHAIERESQRYITEQSVREDVRQAVRRIVDDFIGGRLKRDEYFKVINRETCAVSVCALSLAGKRIRKIVVVTSYVWDGRMNIDKGASYYIGEESPAYIEAKEWNADNQDIVKDYMDWKRDVPINRQRRKAENEYEYRWNRDIPPAKKMELMNITYNNYEKSKRKAIHNAMAPSEFAAVQDYYRKMDSQPMASKGSANRDLRALDLRKIRRQRDKDENS
jgi:hypothetical protein